MRTIKGCCPLDCPDTCAWVAHVEEGRVLRVEGARDHPITRGVLCAKVRDYPERGYAPDRLLHPLLRSGPKGSGDRTSAECGIEKGVLIALAQEIARARPALIRLGVGPQQTSNGDALVRGVSALCVLGGHWRQPGGGLYLYAAPEMDEIAASRPDLQAGEPRSLDMAKLGSILCDSELEPAIRGLMVWTSNPAVTLPDSIRVRRGLGREDLFTVVLEHFMTDTARFADIVLPATTQLEHFDVLGAWGHH